MLDKDNRVKFSNSNKFGKGSMIIVQELNIIGLKWKNEEGFSVVEKNKIDPKVYEK